jgi:hypothetical protein
MAKVDRSSDASGYATGFWTIIEQALFFPGNNADIYACGQQVEDTLAKAMVDAGEPEIEKVSYQVPANPREIEKNSEC